MNIKPLLLTLLLSPLACAQTFEQQLATELAEGMDGKVDFVPIQADYNYGYGTRTDVYLLPGGGIDVQNHMSSGPENEVRLYDEEVRLIPITQPAPQGRELQPGVRRLWGE